VHEPVGCAEDSAGVIEQGSRDEAGRAAGGGGQPGGDLGGRGEVAVDLKRGDSTVNERLDQLRSGAY
jgi:hypothetical protein